MFFILSRIFNFLIAPFTWIVICLVLAILKKDPVKKRKYLIASFLLLIFFSNTFIFDRFMNAWEVKAIPDSDLPVCDAGILLTGMAAFDPQLKRLEYNDRTDRLMQAVRLFKMNKINFLILCGGPVTLTGSDTLELPLLKSQIVSLGIPADRIVIENKSRNTHENAVNLKSILKSNFPRGKFLLITSAAHLKRAYLCFNKVGISTIPYSTDRFSGPVKFDPDYLLLPSSATLFNWEKLLHEWIGMLSYWLMGYV